MTDGNYWTPVARGTKGEDGRGISSTVVEYAVSSDGSTAPVAGWSQTLPAVSAGFYLWTRTTVNYTDGSSSESYSVARSGADGKAGAACPYQGVYSNTKTYYGNETRRDVVSYNGRYYVALPGVDGGSFSGKTPTNTAYWTPFGATFDNIATGFLFAEEAWVENLGVSFLKTGTSGKRVLINEDGSGNISVYDSTNECVRITGDNIGDLSEQFDELAKNSTGSNKVMDGMYNQKEVEYSKELYTLSISQTIRQGDTVSVRNITGDVSPKLPDAAMADPSGSVLVNFSNIMVSYILCRGGDEVKRIGLVQFAGIGGNPVKIDDRVTSDYTHTGASVGGWSIKVVFSCSIQRDYMIGNLTSTSASYGFDAYITHSGQRTMLIGADGFFYVFGPNNHVYFSVNNGISFRSSGVGIAIKDDRMTFMLGGIEYAVSVVNNTIRLAAV